MSLFTKVASDQELELVAMRAAEIAWAVEQETGIPPKPEDIQSVVEFALKELDRKADKSGKNLAALGTMALLTEGNFLKELLEYRERNPGKPLPAGFRPKMLAAMKQMVGAYLAHKEQSER